MLSSKRGGGKGPIRTVNDQAMRKAKSRADRGVLSRATATSIRSYGSTRTFRDVGRMQLTASQQPKLEAAITNLGNGAPICPPLVLSPVMMGNNRLSSMAALFQEWKPRRLRLTYVPTVGNFNNGKYLMACSRDPTWIPVTYSTQNTQIQVFDNQKMSEADIFCDFFIGAEGDIECATGLMQEDWLLVCAANAGGILARMYTAGIVYFTIDGSPTNQSGTALTGQTGTFWLEWDIEFRKPCDNSIARIEAYIFNDIKVTSVVTTVGNPVQFTLSSVAAGGAVYANKQVMIIYPENDLVASTHNVNLANCPMYLGANTAAAGQYYLYTTLFDAVNATTANRILTVTEDATAQSQDVGVIFPATTLTP